MKRHFLTGLKALAVGVMTLLAVSCYDDSKLWEGIEDLKGRVDALEQKLNEQVETLNAEIAKLDAKVAVVDVKKVEDNYVLTFADGSKLTVAAGGTKGFVTTVDIEGTTFWAILDENGEPQILDAVVHPDTQLKFSVNPDTYEVSVSYDNGKTWVPTGVKVKDETTLNVFTALDYKEGADFLTITVGGKQYRLPVYNDDTSSIVLGRSDFFLRYEGVKEVTLTAVDMSEYYVMSKPDGWKASLVDNVLTVTAPTKAAVKIGAAETEGEILVHATTTEGKCKIAKIDVTAGEGLTLDVDAEGNVTIKNSYYGTSTTEDGEIFGSFNNIAFGLATPDFFFAGTPAEYVTAAYNETSRDWFGLSVPNLYNLVEAGVYEEGKYETDIVKTSVADFYFDYLYEELPLGSYYVVWAAPVDNDGELVADEACFVEYIYHEWEAEVSGITHSDAVLKLNVEGADAYAIGYACPKDWNYDPIMNPLTFDDFMLSPMGGRWSSFKSWGAMEALGMIVPGDAVEAINGEFKLSEFFGSKLSFNTEYYLWVMPIFDFMAKIDMENSYPEEDYYVYDYSAYDYDKNFKPYVVSFKTNDIVAGGDYAASLEMTKNDYTSITVMLTPSEGTETVYYKWYNEKAFDQFENDSEIVAELLEDCYNPASAPQTVKLTNKKPGEVWVLATFSIGADGKHGTVVSKKFNTVPVPVKEDITVQVVSCVEDADGKNFIVTVKATGATKVIAWNMTKSDTNDAAFLGNVCMYGTKASYVGYTFATLADGQAVLTVKKDQYKKNLYVAAYNVENNMVSAVSKTPVVIDLYPETAE